MKNRGFASCFSRASAFKGVTITEYGLALGLIAIAAVVGIATLGGSISTLLSNSKVAAGGSGSTLDLLKPAKSGGSASAGNEAGASKKSGGYYVMVSDPTTGAPMLQMVVGTSDDPTNATSLDGNTRNTLGSLILANQMSELAEQQRSPELKAYYQKMAEMSYYLGAAEGEMDEVEGLALWQDFGNGATYSKGDALNDIMYYQGELQKLMSNPPPGANPRDMAKALPLAADTYNIAEKYKATFSRFIGPDGKVTQNFGLCAEFCPGGDGSSGSSLALADQMTSSPSLAMMHTRYHELIPYGTVQQQAQAILQHNKVGSVHVEATLSNAAALQKVQQ